MGVVIVTTKHHETSNGNFNAFYCSGAGCNKAGRVGAQTSGVSSRGGIVTVAPTSPKFTAPIVAPKAAGAMDVE
jgi:hypothetical protein